MESNPGNKLTVLIEAAKAATPLWDRWNGCDGPCDDYLALANPATILELCALLEKTEDALEEANALNQNWSSDADPEMLSYYSEYRAVIKQGNDALAAIKQWKEQT